MNRAPKAKRMNTLMMIVILALIIMNFNKAAMQSGSGSAGENIYTYLDSSYAAQTQAPELSEEQSVEIYYAASEAVAYMFTDAGREAGGAGGTGYFRFDYDLDGYDDLIVGRADGTWMVCTGGRADIDCYLLEDAEQWLSEHRAELQPAAFSFDRETGIDASLIGRVDALLEKFPFVMDAARLDLNSDGTDDYVLSLEADPDFGPRGVEFLSSGSHRLDGVWTGCRMVLESSGSGIAVRICGADAALDLTGASDAS